MTIPEALEKLDQLQAQIIHGGTPFKDIADAIRQTMEWKPIATAPQDGNVFLAFTPHEESGYSFVACFTTDHRLVSMMTGSDEIGVTHWMPLPPHPTKRPVRSDMTAVKLVGGPFDGLIEVATIGANARAKTVDGHRHFYVPEGGVVTLETKELRHGYSLPVSENHIPEKSNPAKARDPINPNRPDLDDYPKSPGRMHS